MKNKKNKKYDEKIAINASFNEMIKESVSDNPKPQKTYLKFTVEIEGESYRFNEQSEGYYIFMNKDGLAMPVIKNKAGNWAISDNPEFGVLNGKIDSIIKKQEAKNKKAQG